MKIRTTIVTLFLILTASLAYAGDCIYTIDNFTAETVGHWRSTNGEQWSLTAKPEGSEFVADFSSEKEIPRSSFDWDFSKPVDLSEFTRIEVELDVENPDAFAYSSLYFSSGDGWYAATAAVPSGRGVMTYRKANFTTEGKPAGWDKIDGVRLAIWRGRSQKSRVIYYSLRCVMEQVLFINVPNSEGVVPWVGTNNGRMIQSQLREFGLAADDVTLPRNADDNWFNRLDNRGAVIVVCDKFLSPELKANLESHAKAKNVPLMLLNTDLREKPLESPALLEFLVQRDDVKSMIRKYMLEQATVAAEQTVSNADEVKAKMTNVESEQGFLAFVEACKQSHFNALKAQAAVVRDSQCLKLRGWWNHNGLGAYRGDWERTAKELQEAGFTAVFPNLLWSGEALYPSDLIPPAKVVEELGDQMDACVKACHAHGIQVHVWKVNFNLQWHVTKERLEQFRQEGRLQKDVQGDDFPWLCPSNPKNIELEVNSMIEMATKYPIDGIHFDYIRYYGPDFCFCDGCRQRFEEARGKKVENWPDDCFKGKLQDEWTQWRAGLITNIVRTTHDKLKAIRPDCKVSAAVFIQYPSCAKSLGQDWASWANDGIVDFLCPMNYTMDAASYGRMITRQREFVKPDFPLYPGIGNWKLTPDGTVGQLRKAHDLNCPGFMIFDLTEQSAGQILPLLKK